MAKLPKASFISRILRRKPKVTGEAADVKRLQRARKIDEGRITKTSRAEKFENVKKVGRSLKGYAIATGAGVAGALGDQAVKKATEGKRKKK